MKKTYLNEFLDNDLIDEVQSQLDKRQKIYFPLVDLDLDLKASTSASETATETTEKISILSNMTSFDNFLQYPMIITPPKRLAVTMKTS